MQNPIHLTFLLAFLLAAIGSVRADSNAGDPEFEKFLLQEHYGPVLTTGEDNQQFVVAMINGKPVKLEIDSGAANTTLTRDCAERLGLAIKDTGKTTSGLGGSNYGTTGLAPISSFTINNWEMNRLSEIPVFPESVYLQNADGLLGFDYLRLNAAIMIVGGAGILVRPGTLTEPASVGRYMLKSGFTPIPLTISKNRLMTRGVFAGHPLHAQIDCGAAYTCFEMDYIRKIDFLTSGSGSILGIDGRTIHVQELQTAAFSLGPYQVPHELMVAGFSPPLEKEGTDVLLGFDFLSAHHGVLDTGSATLWMK